MNSYELTVVLRVSESQDASTEKIKSVLQKFGASVLSEDVWGVRRLAYMIGGEKDGHYTIMNVEVPPESIKKIGSEFRLMPDVLRFLFVKIKKQKSA